MLYEAIFLSTCNATMMNEKTFKLQRECHTLSNFFAQLATRTDAQSRRHLAIALLLLAELDNDEDLECHGRERSVWVTPWLARREERGCFHQVACSCFLLTPRVIMSLRNV